MLQLMIIEEMPLDRISFENEAFRISEVLESASVRDSLSRIGQLNPVVLLEQAPQMVLVCGFRRAHALKQLGKPGMLARILPPGDREAPRAFELALWDNLSHRQLNPLEKARALLKLRNICGIHDEKLVSLYLPALGLSSSPSVLQNYLLLNGIHEGLRQCLMEGRLTHSSLEFLGPQPMPIQEGIAALMDKIRLSASLQKKVLDLMDELSSMTGASFDAPLKEPQVLTILEDAALSPFQKGEKVYESLYRRMHPRLSRAHDRFQNQKGLLNLPGAIQINAHPFFEEPGIRVAFDAPDATRFRRLTASLQKAAASSDVEGLFKIE